MSKKINNKSVSHRRNDAEYVTTAIHPLMEGTFEFSSHGPNGMTKWLVKTCFEFQCQSYTVKVVNQNIISCKKKVSFTVEYATVYNRWQFAAQKFDWIDVTGPPFEFREDIETKDLLVKLLVLKVVTKKESTDHDQTSLNDLDIYNNKEFSDVVVKCGNTKFECHQVFLATRSPVFKAMLTTNMREKINNEIQVDDIKPEVMAELLEFIYIGKVSNLDKFALDLFIAADKYQINSLKDLCEKKLINSLAMENCFSLLIMGDMLSPSIKKIALKFVVENRESIEIQEELANYPSLMMEILKKVFGKGMLSKKE